MCAIGKANS
jgi:hypothetical protein